MKKYLQVLIEQAEKNDEVLPTVGKHNHIPDSAFDPEQLRMGIEVEKEHTDDPEIAKKIAKDHLCEPGLHDYYTRLLAMEKQAKRERGIPDDED